MKRFFKIVLLLVLIISVLISTVYGAIDIKDLDGSGAKTGSIKTAGGSILSYLAIIASAMSIITMIALGIKYMMGSVEERAEYKKTLLPYFIGAAFVFGATAIPQIVYNMFK